MVKAPSSHGLDRKFKSWRRGKSENAKPRGSLKQQLRNHERALNRAKEEDHKKGLLEKIRVLKEEIDGKQATEKERQHAKESHGARFLERQKLTRMERNLNNNPNLSATQKEKELVKIGLDQVYVAHYPMNIRYLPLFTKVVRRVDPAKVLAQRAKTRQRILAEQFSDSPQTPKTETKSWISVEQYDRVKTIAGQGWSVERERETFGEASSAEAAREAGGADDDRFNAQSQHEDLLAAAEKAEAQLDKEEDAKEEEEVGVSGRTKTSKNDESSSSSSDDDSTSSGSAPSKKKKNTEPIAEVNNGKRKLNEESSSSDDSSSASSSSDDDNSIASSSIKKAAASEPKNDAIITEATDKTYAMEDDDFLMPVAESSDDANLNVFAKPQEHMSAIDSAKGDKSQGWATQRQRPGQFKKRKIKGKY
jgi:hypothetical protein